MEQGAAVERALVHGLCGVGGLLARPPSSLTEAVHEVAGRYGERTAHRLARFAAAPDGAFVWARDADGLFWLGRLGGPWHYDRRAEASEVDLVHVRACFWRDTPTADAEVPLGVRATFARGGRNWQEIHDDAVRVLTGRLWHG